MELIGLIILALLAWFIYKIYTGYKSVPNHTNLNINSQENRNTINEIIQNCESELERKGFSRNEIETMKNLIGDYVKNKFISRNDLSFIEFYKYQNLIQCPECLNRYSIYSDIQVMKNILDDSIEIKCDKCRVAKVLTYQDYQTRSISYMYWEIEESNPQRKILQEKYKDYLLDQKKLHDLFLKKGIAINYFDIIPLMSKVEYDIFTDFTYSSIIEPAYNKIKSNLPYTSDPQLIIQEFLKISPELTIPSIIIDKQEVSLIKSLLKKFGLDIHENEIPSILKDAIEHNSLENFEKTLGNEKLPLFYDFTELSGVEFEDYVKKVFEQLGFNVSETSKTGDQGADLLVNKAGVKTVVQIKNHSKKISNKAIQEVVAAMRYYDATEAKVVVSSTFTEGAIDLAAKNDVELWDGQKLKNTVRQINDS